jgi:hypothetical protein
MFTFNLDLLYFLPYRAICFTFCHTVPFTRRLAKCIVTLQRLDRLFCVSHTNRLPCHFKLALHRVRGVADINRCYHYCYTECRSEKESRAKVYTSTRQHPCCTGTMLESKLVKVILNSFCFLWTPSTVEYWRQCCFALYFPNFFSCAACPSIARLRFLGIL